MSVAAENDLQGVREDNMPLDEDNPSSSAATTAHFGDGSDKDQSLLTAEQDPYEIEVAPGTY